MNELGARPGRLRFMVGNRSAGWTPFVARARELYGPSVTGGEMWDAGFRLNLDDERLVYQQYLYRMFSKPVPEEDEEEEATDPLTVRIRNFKGYIVWRYNAALFNLRRTERRRRS